MGSLRVRFLSICRKAFTFSPPGLNFSFLGVNSCSRFLHHPAGHFGPHKNPRLATCSDVKASRASYIHNGGQVSMGVLGRRRGQGGRTAS